MALITRRQKEEFKKAFVLFDDNGDGTICLDELEDVLRCLGQRPTADNVTEMVMSFDKGKDGTIDFDEFCELMSSKTSFCKPIPVPQAYLDLKGVTEQVDMGLLVGITKVLLKMRERGQEEDPRFDVLTDVVNEQRAVRESAKHDNEWATNGKSPNEAVFMWRDLSVASGKRLNKVRSKRAVVNDAINVGRIEAAARAHERLRPPKRNYRIERGGPRHPHTIAQSLVSMPRPFSVGPTPTNCGGEVSYGPKRYYSPAVDLNIDPYDVQGQTLYRPESEEPDAWSDRSRLLELPPRELRPSTAPSPVRGKGRGKGRGGGLTRTGGATGGAAGAAGAAGQGAKRPPQPQDEKMGTGTGMSMSGLADSLAITTGASAASSSALGGPSAGPPGRQKARKCKEPRPQYHPMDKGLGHSGAREGTEPDHYSAARIFPNGRLLEWENAARIDRFDGCTEADRGRSLRHHGHCTDGKRELSFLASFGRGVPSVAERGAEILNAVDMHLETQQTLRREGSGSFNGSTPDMKLTAGRVHRVGAIWSK